MAWLYSWANLPYWILLGVGIILFVVVIATGGDEGDADNEVLEWEAEVTDLGESWGFLPLLGWLGVGRAPLILLTATNLSLWGILGWIANAIAAQLLGQIPVAFLGLAGAIFMGSGILALWLGSWIARPIGSLFAPFGEDVSGDRLMGCLGTVSSKALPYLTEGRIGQVDVTDPNNNLVTVSAVLPQWATTVPHRGQSVVIIDLRPNEFYVAIAKDTADEDRWLTTQESQA